MSLIAKDKGADFVPAPEGLHKFVCVDVVDLGRVPGIFGEKDKIKLVLQIDKINPVNNKRYEVHQMYNLSLNEKATLSKHLESWRGRKFNADDRKSGFDIERIVGGCGQVHIVHNITNKGTYANIAALVPLAPEMAKMEPLEYVRVRDRAEKEQPPAQDADDDIPF